MQPISKLLTVSILLLAMAHQAWAEEEEIAPPPLAGTLLAGPYLMGPEPGQMVVQWEIQGPKDSAIILLLADGTEGRHAGQLMPADQLTRKLLGRVYRVVLADLEPCTRYRYRLVPFELETTHAFRTPPRPGEYCSAPVSIAVIGDTRSHPTRHAKVVNEMLPHQPDLVINTGDVISYARRIDQWHEFFGVARPLLADAPLALAPGNHEGYEDEPFGAAMMERYFGLPGRSGVGHYSFDYGAVHVVILDPYWGRPLSDKGKRWLRADLAAVPKDRFKLVAIHTPLYSFGRHKVYSTAIGLREVMKEYGVHAVFSGHSHTYEHFLADGTHYLTLGGGGASFHEPNMQVIPEEQHLLLNSGKFHHFLLIDVDSEGLRMRVFNTDEKVIHEEWKIPK
jgi:acid phosphatase type 7